LTLHASYEHRFDLGSLGTLIPQVDVQYKSEYKLSFDRILTPAAVATGGDAYSGDYRYWSAPWNRQEAHYILNASAVFNHSSDIWSIRAYVKNITEYAAKNAMTGRFDVRLAVSDPRTFGAVLSVKF